MQKDHPGVLAERRADILSQLVVLFAQGRDPLELAEDAVQIVARATQTAAVFVYLWSDEEERLVLRVATPGPQMSGVGEIRLRLGEGFAGWVAMRQQSVIVERAPQADPRFVGFDEIDEDEFNSMLAAPIADEQNTLRGVFALYSKEEAAFGEDELAIAVEVGRLLASGMVRAETIEDLNRQSASARFLVDFPTGSTTSLVLALQYAARRILALVDSEVLMLEYISRREAGAAPITFAFRAASGEHQTWATRSRLAAQARADQQTAGMESISVVLGMGASRGVLTCYRAQRFRSRDLDRLSTLASQLGVLLEAVDLNSVGSSLAARLLYAYDDSAVARTLDELGVEGAICPVAIRVRGTQADWDSTSRSLKDALASAGGGRAVVLLDSTWALMLAEAPGGRAPADLSHNIRLAMERLALEIGLRASVGIGSATADLTTARASIGHARAALEWAEFIERSEPVSIVSYAEMRDVAGLPSVIGELSADVVARARALDPLVRYDLKQGSELVRTLSVLATCGGSVQETAVQLMIHRNTLRQRMQRIEQVLGEHLSSSDDWLTWALAARVADSRIAQNRSVKHVPANRRP